jgi:hypothetical protein
MRIDHAGFSVRVCKEVAAAELSRPSLPSGALRATSRAPNNGGAEKAQARTGAALAAPAVDRSCGAAPAASRPKGAALAAAQQGRRRNQFLGGGFGRRLEVDGITLAVRIDFRFAAALEV